MAGNAGGIRAGKAYVEIGTNDSALQKGLARAERRLKAFGASVQNLGRNFLAIGAAAATPLAAGVRAFSSYEDAMAALRANAQPTADELKRIESAIMNMSRSTGKGPAEVALAMGELRKAGMDLESVLGGATEATLEFARVAEMEAAEAAVVLNDAVTLFGTDATSAANALTRAADASSISVREVAQSFSQGGSQARDAGLAIEEAAQAIAILGQNGVKGSDAGTSLKTMLVRLQTGAESAGEMMELLGINVRDARGNMMGMRGIIGELQASLAGLSSESRDQALFKLFGTDAIRAGSILLRDGVEGWDRFSAAMEEGLPVADKYAILMDSLSGSAQKAWSALQRVGIAVGKSIGPTLGLWADKLVTVAEVIGTVVRNNQGLVLAIFKGTVAVIGIGAALVGVGLAAKLAAFAFGSLAAVVGMLTSPITLVVAAIAGATFAFFRFTEAGRRAFAALRADAEESFAGIADALKSGDISLAAEILWLSLQVQWQKGINALNAVWQDWSTATRTVFSDLSFWIARRMVDTGAAIRSAFVSAGGAIREVWEGVVSGLWLAWNHQVGQIARSLVSLGKLFSTVFVTLGLHRADQAFAEATAAMEQRLAEIEGKHQQRKQERSDARQGQLDGIESDRQLAQQALDDQQAEADEGRFADSRLALAGGEEELDRLQSELQAALDEAKSKAVPAEAEGAGGAAAGPGRLTPEGLGASLDRAARKTDVKGTFSAAALRGFGAGDSAADRTADAAEKTAEGIQRLNDRARQGRLVFTS